MGMSNIQVLLMCLNINLYTTWKQKVMYTSVCGSAIELQ